LARHKKTDWKLSDAAYDTIVALTNKYNNLNNGKWEGIMDFRPRELAVFDKAVQVKPNQPLVQPAKPLLVLNGTDYKTFLGQKPLAHGLGYQGSAVSLPKRSSVQFSIVFHQSDSIRIEVALAPNHPADGTKIRYTIQLDNGPVQIIDYATEGRSEEWKQNVLTNHATRTTRHFVDRPGKHVLKIRAVDDGVILDQVKIFNE
jgi:hypothetical protein